jgi:hypothetical protein
LKNIHRSVGSCVGGKKGMEEIDLNKIGWYKLNNKIE